MSAGVSCDHERTSLTNSRTVLSLRRGPALTGSCLQSSRLPGFLSKTHSLRLKITSVGMYCFFAEATRRAKMVSFFLSTSATRNLKIGSAAVRFIHSTVVWWWNLRFSTAIALICSAVAKEAISDCWKEDYLLGYAPPIISRLCVFNFLRLSMFSCSSSHPLWS